MLSPSKTLLRSTLVLLATLASSFGNLTPKKIQIQVPHTIQHHHHTHTKLHIITVPVPVRMNDTKAPTPTPGIIGVMPILPFNTTFQPGVFPNPNLPGTGIQTNALFPQQPNNGVFPPFGTQQPNFGGNVFPPNNAGGGFQQGGFQQNNGGGFQQGGFSQNNGGGGGGGFFNQPPGFQGQSNQWSPVSQPYNDDRDRQSRVDNVHSDSISQAKLQKPEPTQAPALFKTVINVHETKDIPLLELFNLGNIKNLLQKETSKRVKMIPGAEKNSYIKQWLSKPDWTPIQQSSKSYLENKQSYIPELYTEVYQTVKQEPDYREFNPETVSFHLQPRQENETPHWLKVKDFLERQINKDFPDLKVNAELVPVSTPTAVPQPQSRIEDNKETAVTDLTHIGYIVVDDNNKQRFVSLSENGKR